MPVFKFVVSSGKKSYQVEKEQSECPVLGKKIGDTISGDFLGLDGYELAITGGHDKDGFPMHKDIVGVMRKFLLVKKGFGFSGRLKRKKKRTKVRGGLRKKKLFHGNTIDNIVSQINCKIIKAGEKGIDEVLGKKA
ncbi:MAG: 30S ribosomal protein S6e [Candidatus Aenigmarchaeota archaeon]|nr:30S ribosomal protein S6e [Candidatus Aenigmarchaeota archaeon]